MEQIFNKFIEQASTFQKGVFLMIAGVCIVFVVQLIFIAIVKIWTTAGKRSINGEGAGTNRELNP